MEAADPADLKQKVDKAKAILSKVTIPALSTTPPSN